MIPPREFPLTEPSIDFETAAGSRIRRTVLPTGLRILSEEMPAAQSATIGFWVGVGSRDELATDSAVGASGFGSTHFLEHLLFKGTPSRSALDIAIAFDAVGGEHNALTAKEYTCYYAKVRDQDLSMATSVLADMIASSLIDPEEFERERQVIIEELAMREDDPGTAVWELLFEAVLGDHPLARPIGGTPQTIEECTREAVLEHYARNYRAADVVISAAGAVRHDELVAEVVAALTAAGWDQSIEAAPVSRRPLVAVDTTPARSLIVEHRPIEQVHLLLGCTGIAMRDERWPVMSILNSILGGGMSSRLFQEVREKRGLAYSVYSFSSAFSDTGVFGMGAACTPARAREVADLMHAELVAMATDGVTEEELSRALGQLSGASALALEDSDSRMSRLGRADLILGEFQELDTILGMLASVTAEDVRTLARELADRSFTVAAVGAIDESVFDGFGEPGEGNRS
ncbi:insulinase family protein [Mycetocola tolaasinivorans]|uniref:Insulinase family protein n=1 Tax=Mycetocola tolaasinivorans TaxID=76635 RepID=A0A3L7ABN4_9MICO|nr:pitrilysin family protein [Mycetocola tolaasinivorans]RLP77763.1 insulinase family protein [Mycetocola tolaasinivorans]